MTEHFPTTKYPDEKAARRARDLRARELRRAGFTVTCKRWDFTDLARAIDYTLTYEAPPVAKEG